MRKIGIYFMCLKFISDSSPIESLAPWRRLAITFEWRVGSEETSVLR
jgi:hypothetical protein